jgi:hypothetical protein
MDMLLTRFVHDIEDVPQRKTHFFANTLSWIVHTLANQAFPINGIISDVSWRI